METIAARPYTQKNRHHTMPNRVLKSVIGDASKWKMAEK
jgi:hypothetical protein